MICYHQCSLIVYRALFRFQIALDEARQFIIALFLALEHHSALLSLSNNLLSTINRTVFIGQNQYGGRLWFLEIRLQTVPVLNILRLFHDDNLPFGHHREAASQIGHLPSADISTEHHRLIEVAFLLTQHMLCDIVGYPVDIVRLLTHQYIYGSILPDLQVVHDRFESGSTRLLFSHSLLVYRINTIFT